MDNSKQILWKFLMAQNLTKLQNGGECHVCNQLKRYDEGGSNEVQLRTNMYPGNSVPVLNQISPNAAPTSDSHIRREYELAWMAPYVSHTSGYGSHTTPFERMLYNSGAGGFSTTTNRAPILGANNSVVGYGQFDQGNTNYDNMHVYDETGITGRYLPRTGSPFTFRNSQAGLGISFGNAGNYYSASDFNNIDEQSYLGPYVHLHPEIGFQPSFVTQSPMGIRKEIRTSPFYGYVNADLVHNFDVLGQGMTNQRYMDMGRNKFTVGAGARYTFPNSNDYFQHPFIEGNANYNVYTKQPQFQIGVGSNI